MRISPVLVLTLVTAALLAIGYTGASDPGLVRYKLLTIGLVAAYFYPTLVLLLRDAGDPEGRTGFFLGNLFGAWTVIGWVLLVIAAFALKRQFNYERDITNATPIANSNDPIQLSIDEGEFLKRVGSDLENTVARRPSQVHIVPWQPIPGDPHRPGRAVSPFRDAMQRSVKKFGGSTMTTSSTALLARSTESALRSFNDYSVLVIDWERSGVSDFGLSELKAFLDSRKAWGSHWLVVERDQVGALVSGIGGDPDVLPDTFLTATDRHALGKQDPASALGLRVRPKGPGFFSRLFSRSSD